MKMKILGFLLIFACNTGLHCQSSSREAEIRATEKRWDNALLVGDGAALKEILSDDFVLTDASGTMVTKAALIEGLKPSKSKQRKSNHTEDANVRIYGDTAVVTGLYVEDGIYNAKPYRIETRYTDVYVWQDHAWRGVAAHSSGQKITLDGRPYVPEESEKKH